jgi:uncharacterized protein (TIRG00374 family)
MVLSPKLRARASRWRILWYPVIGIIAIDLMYQVLISWRQASIIAKAQPIYLVLAVFNQLAIYLVLVPPMQEFFAAAKIRLTGRRAFSILAMGLAFARIIPLGDYLVWRTSMRRARGGVSATTQWYVMYYSWMFSGLIIVFLLAEGMTYVLHPHADVSTLVGYLRFLPIMFSLFVVAGLLATRIAWVRDRVKQLVFDRLGSQSLLPMGIIRDRNLGGNVLGLLTFASIANWLMEGYTLYLCLRAIGLNIPLSISLFGFAFARLFSIIPITPGGIGQLEAGSALFFAAYGYAFAPILTATVLYRLISYWPALIIGATTYGISRNTEGENALSFDKAVFSTHLHSR